MEKTIILKETLIDGKLTIEVQLLKGEQMYARDAMHLCCGAIGVLIKSIHKTGAAKDYELVKDAIKHIEDEFVSPTAFQDAGLDTNVLK